MHSTDTRGGRHKWHAKSIGRNVVHVVGRCCHYYSGAAARLQFATERWGEDDNAPPIVVAVVVVRFQVVMQVGRVWAIHTPYVEYFMQ